jgi:cytochrome c556
MRALILLVIGLVMGAIASMFAANTLSARHTYPRGIMAIMQHHVVGLHQALRTRQCNAATNSDAFARIGHAAGEIDPAFAGADADFFTHARKLDESLAAAQAAAPADCPALQSALKRVDDACDSCHQLYR